MPVCEKCKKDMPIQGFEAHQRFCKGKEQNPPELTTQDLAPEKVTSPTIVVPKKLKPEVDDEEQQEELLKLREEISKKNTTIERYKNIKNELDKLKEELETLKAGAITKIDIDNIKISIAETKLECKDLSEKNTQKIPVILRETEVISKRIDNINKDMVLPYEKIKEEKQNILIKLDKHIKETEDKDKNFELDITEIREDLKEKLITAGDILKIKEEFKNASELKEKKIKEDFENAYANMMIRFNEIHATSVRNLESRYDGLLLKKKSENGLKPKVVAVEKQIPLDDKSRGGLNLSLNEKISAIVIGIIVLILLWFIL